MSIPLEDTFADIIGKAKRGLGISDNQLAEKSGAKADAIDQLFDGKFDLATLEHVAPLLQLDPGSLADLAQGKYRPNEIHLDGLAQFTTPYHDVQVNAYLVWDPASKDAVAFDSGTNCSPMLEQAKKNGLTIKLILLTHAHTDHIADLGQLTGATGAPIYLSSREKAPGAQAIDEGRKFTIGSLGIESRLTWGHSPGGMTFVINGLAAPVAIVGDSIFAGSMGGGNVSYPDAVQNNLEKILTLPNETVLCPGHGPMTTVGEEKEHNAFFAGRI